MKLNQSLIVALNEVLQASHISGFVLLQQFLMFWSEIRIEAIEAHHASKIGAL
jgi:hypothetical protein